MKARIYLACAVLACTASTSWALDASGERYTKMLASGGPSTIRAAAEDIYNAGVRDEAVLDVTAQVLSDIHMKNPGSRDYADATSWLCKALGNSSNGRYRAIVEQVVNAGIHRKTRSHCQKALNNLPGNAATSFRPGSINVAAYRDGGTSQNAVKSTAATPAAKPVAGSGQGVNFGLIREGMSQQEVDDLLGPPTNQVSYMTGKQWMPFNYGARDLRRTKYLYKGVGHIVFSMKTAYNGIFRVIEIVPDSAESGYP